jgi:hypothetical protein
MVECLQAADLAVSAEDEVGFREALAEAIG